MEPFAVPPELKQALQDLAQREGVTLAITLQSMFNVLLYRYTGQDDIAVGSPIANRNREEIEGLIGLVDSMASSFLGGATVPRLGLKAMVTAAKKAEAEPAAEQPPQQPPEVDEDDPYDPADATPANGIVGSSRKSSKQSL